MELNLLLVWRELVMGVIQFEYLTGFWFPFWPSASIGLTLNLNYDKWRYMVMDGWDVSIQMLGICTLRAFEAERSRHTCWRIIKFFTLNFNFWGKLVLPQVCDEIAQMVERQTVEREISDSNRAASKFFGAILQQ